MYYCNRYFRVFRRTGHIFRTFILAIERQTSLFFRKHQFETIVISNKCISYTWTLLGNLARHSSSITNITLNRKIERTLHDPHAIACISHARPSLTLSLSVPTNKNVGSTHPRHANEQCARARHSLHTWTTRMECSGISFRFKSDTQLCVRSCWRITFVAISSHTRAITRSRTANVRHVIVQNAAHLQSDWIDFWW